MHRTFIMILAIAAMVLPGCTTPSETQSPGQLDGLQTPPSEASWHLQAKRSLGFYVGVQIPPASIARPAPGYCRDLDFVVPGGATRLELTFTSTPANASSGSAGLLGFYAYSESQDQGANYPDVTAPQGFLDDPKRLSFDDPQEGPWTVHVYTIGAAVQQLGNLTIDVQGTSVEVPQELAIEMIC